MKEELNKALGELNSTLREQLIDTRLISILDWNDYIAPKLSNVAKVIDGSKVTARTFKLPFNYHDEDH